ncbi:MAG TPA: SpoIIE family protein phosphatase [Leptospiraceae bacterium]|nr:SpoIIE family protein phosphatase [Leptospiraceae bacterium]HNE53384.1 SpoIIE family protein phosphatase [Leptospiraceae bacterium]HNF55771.1 SpoIIE family protein phosphatase [Leptospiraceae bacterium]
METIFHQLPVLPTNPTAWEYFWNQMSHGFPTGLTVVIGFFIAMLGFWSAYNDKEKRDYYISFSLLVLGLTGFVFLYFVRFVFWDTERILFLNLFIYPIFRLVTFGLTYFAMVSTQKTKFMKFLLLITVFIEVKILYHTFLGEGFTGAFYENELGKFPIITKGRGVLVLLPAIIGLYDIIRISYFIFLKKSKIHISIVIAVIGFFILNINSALLATGDSKLPLVVFSFVPMFLIAYGVFHSDFLNLNELLFKKNLLFYIFSVSISILFLFVSILVAYYLNPEHGFHYRNGYFLISLFSFVTTICLSAYIAGNKPDDKFVMFVALNIFIQGFLAFLVMIRGLYLPLIIEHRLNQILFLFFAFSSSIGFRILYLGYNKPIPKLSYLIDISNLICSLFALSPYFFNGYYEYNWGRYPSAGIFLQISQTIIVLVLLKVLYDWIQFRKSNKNSLVDWIMICSIIGAFLSIGSIPATRGIEFYPLINFQFIVTFLYAFAIIKFNTLPIQGESTALTNRISFYAIFVIPIILLFYSSNLSKEIQGTQIVYHLSLIGSSALVSFFAFTFILLRPIARKLDEEKDKIEEARKQADKEKAIAILARLETEKQKKETEELNKLVKSLNEELDLKVIMEKVHKYVKENFGIEYYGLFTVSQNNTYIRPLDMYFADFVMEEDRSKIFNFKIPIKEERSGHAFPIKSKRPFYLPKMRTLAATKEEIYFSEKCRIQSFILIPLFLNNEPIGTLDLYNSSKRMNLSKDDITRLSILGEQLAGIIYGSNLYKQVEEKTVELNRSLQLIKKDLNFSSKIQKKLLPRESLQISGLNISSFYAPMDEVGGDFFDITVHENKIRILIADATGHGVQAALITMLIKSEFETVKHSSSSPSNLLNELNSSFCSKYSNLETLFSCFIADIDPIERKLEYASAGHPAQLLASNHEIIELRNTGRIIGLKKDTNYQNIKIDFPSGSKLFLFTDGLYEEINLKEEEFGEERLKQNLFQYKENHSDLIIENVISDLKNFLGESEIHDDITFVIAEW